MTTIDLQTLINNTPNFGELNLPADATQTLTQSIQIYNRQGLKIKALGGIGSSSTGTPANQSGAILRWQGPPTSPVIDVQSSRGITIEGLTIQCMADADSGINFDLLPTGSHQICTDESLLGPDHAVELPDLQSNEYLLVSYKCIPNVLSKSS